MAFNYERNAAQEGIGKGIGVGQSILGMFKELANERQNNRLLQFQMQTHYENMARQDAERQQNMQVQDRQLRLAEKLGDAQAKMWGRMPTERGEGKDPQIETAQKILQNQYSTDSELLWAKQKLGLPLTKMVEQPKKGWNVFQPKTWTDKEMVEVPIEQQLSPAMQNVAGAGMRNPIVSQPAQAQQTPVQIDTEMLNKLTAQIPSYKSRQEAIKDIDRLIREGKVSANLKAPLYRAIRTQLK